MTVKYAPTKIGSYLTPYLKVCGYPQGCRFQEILSSRKVQNISENFQTFQKILTKVTLHHWLPSHLRKSGYASPVPSSLQSIECDISYNVMFSLVGLAEQNTDELLKAMV